MELIPPGKVTSLLSALSANQEGAQEELLHLVYAELRRIAASVACPRNEAGSLSPTELVNEAYIRLFGQDDIPDWKSRKHFYCTVALAMRYVLLDDAKSRKAWANGGRAKHVELPHDIGAPAKDPAATLAIDDALNKLQAARSAAAEVFLLEHFGGRSHDQTAAILDIPKAAVRRHWDFAMGFMSQELGTQNKLQKPDAQ